MSEKTQLSYPKFRFKYINVQVGTAPYFRREAKWVQQVACFKDARGNLIWENIENQYYMQDEDGNEKEVSLEEFNKELHHKIKEHY